MGKLLQERLAANGRTATIHKIGLLTWDHRFDIDADIEGYQMTFRIAEEVVDDLFEGGSAEADQRLSRILELALAVRVV